MSVRTVCWIVPTETLARCLGRSPMIGCKERGFARNGYETRRELSYDPLSHRLSQMRNCVTLCRRSRALPASSVLLLALLFHVSRIGSIRGVRFASNLIVDASGFETSDTSEASRIAARLGDSENQSIQMMSRRRANSNMRVADQAAIFARVNLSFR